MRIGIPYIAMLLWLAAGCTQNNVQEDSSLQTVFSQHALSGTFGLYDNGHGSFTIFNLPGFSQTTHPPGPTFHLIEALIGIESGAIVNNTTPLTMDTVPTGSEACKKATTLEDAFPLACDEWFVQLNKQMNKQVFQAYLDTLGYAGGKGKSIVKHVHYAFWHDSTASVTADEQLGLVKKLYFNKLPFQKRSQENAKRLMEKEENPDYLMKYVSGGGWIIGWIEENQHPYFFSLYAADQNGTPASKEKAKALAQSVLTTYGFMKGKK